VSPPQGCHPTPFLPVRPRFFTVLCQFAHKIFPSGVTPWRLSPRAVRPPSDATAVGEMSGSLTAKLFVQLPSRGMRE